MSAGEKICKPDDIEVDVNKDGLTKIHTFFTTLGNFTRVPPFLPQFDNDEKAYLTDLQPVLLKRQSPWPVPVSLVYTTTDIESRLVFLYSLFPMLPITLLDKKQQSFSNEETMKIIEQIKETIEHQKVYTEAKTKRDKARREARKKAREEAKAKEKENEKTSTSTTTTSTSSSSAASTNPLLRTPPSSIPFPPFSKSAPVVNETLDPDPNYDDFDDNEIPTLAPSKTPEELEDEKLKELELLSKPALIPRLYRIKFIDPAGLQVYIERAGESSEPTVTEKAAMYLQKKKDSSPYFKPAVSITGILPNGFANPLPRHDMGAIIYDKDEEEDNKYEDIDNNKDRKQNKQSKVKKLLSPLKQSGVSFVGLLIPLPSTLGEEGAMIALKFWKRLGHDRFSLRNPPHDHALCTDGLVVLAFQRDAEKATPWLLSRPAIMYQTPDPEPVLKQLKSVLPDLQITRTASEMGGGYLYSFEGPSFESFPPSIPSSASTNKSDTGKESTVTYPGPLFVLAAPKSNKLARIITYTGAVLFFIVLMIGLFSFFATPSVRRLVYDYYQAFNNFMKAWARTTSRSNNGFKTRNSPYKGTK